MFIVVGVVEVVVVVAVVLVVAETNPAQWSLTLQNSQRGNFNYSSTGNLLPA